MRQARVWRRDQRALFGGVCAGLAEDLDLPLGLIRIIACVFLLLPTGIAYLAMALLLRAAPSRMAGRPMAWDSAAPPPGFAASGPSSAGSRSWAGNQGGSQNGVQSPSWMLLRQRFAAIEPRLKRIEAFVTSTDFELERGLRGIDAGSPGKRQPPRRDPGP